MATHKAKPLSGISLNYEVVGGTTAPTTFNKENTIWVNTSTAITEHAFGYENPLANEIVENCTIGEANQKMNSSGALTSDVAWSMTKYYPVVLGAQYYLTFVENGACSAYYDKDYTFISSFNVTGNAWTSLPSIPSNAAYVRFCIRTYTDTNDTNKFKYKYTTRNASTGDTWIQTDNNSDIGFNALKKNELMVYPTKLKQWDGSLWKTLAGALYKNGTSNLIYSAEEVFVSGGALQNGITFTKKASHWNASTTGVTMTEKAGSGAYFGYNVSMLSGDIRGYDNVVYNYTRSGNTGQAGYFPIMFVCGTESQISGMRFPKFYEVNYNNCTQLVTAWNENKTFSGTVAIPDSIKNASEPQYLGWLIGSYNGTTATLVLNNISIT